MNGPRDTKEEPILKVLDKLVDRIERTKRRMDYAVSQAAKKMGETSPESVLLVEAWREFCDRGNHK